MKGVVKWFNDARGFGFIRADDGKEVFVRYSAIAGRGFRVLREGDRVSFECEERGSHRHATRVWVAGK